MNFMNTSEMKEKLTEVVTQFRGDSSPHDDLIAYFYKTLRDIDACEGYIKNSQGTRDTDLLEFFKEIQAQNRLRAWRAQELLQRRLN